MDSATLIEAITSTRMVSYITGGCITLLTYDTLLTFPREIETVWTGKWTITKVLYIITRYSAFAESAVLIYQISIPGDQYTHCSMAFKINIMLFLFGLSVGEIIMTIRTWAVWGRNRVLMFVFPMFYLMVTGGSLFSTISFIRDVKFEPNVITTYVGCFATHTSPIVFISWVLLMLYDFVMFVFMGIPAFKAFRSGGSSHLMKVVLRDGVLYYVYLFLLSLANIILTLTLPSALILILSLLSRMLHAILACRVVLDIHDLGRKAVSSGDMHSRDRSQGIQLSSAHRSNPPRPPEAYSQVTVSYYQSTTS